MPSELTEASHHWTETGIPDLHDRTAVVTGASSGLGFEVARMPAGHGATVIMACRNPARAEAAADRIRDTAPGRACGRCRWTWPHWPRSERRPRGSAPSTRVLTCWSTTPAGSTRVTAAPETASRRLWPPTTSARSRSPAWSWSPRLRLLTSWLLQSSQAGALPIARAATDPGVRGGEYYGPSGWREWTGHPGRVQSIPRSHDADAARRLWEVSEQLTAITYDIGAHSGPAAVAHAADETPGGAVAPAEATPPSSAPDRLPPLEKGKP